MLDKLSEVEKRYEEIEHRLYDPSVVADVEQYRQLMKESAALQPIVEKYREYTAAKRYAEEARGLLDGGGLDKEMRELAEQELAENREKAEACAEELKLLLLPRDPNDDRNVIVEIRAGAGGEESALFANSLQRMYTMYAERRGFGTEVMNRNETELGGCKEVSFMVTGDGAYSRFKFESGVHRVQRVPETAGFTPPPPRWRCCPRPRRWSWKSTPRICKSTPTAPAGRAASTSTKPNRPSGSPTCPPARWWNARTSAASSRTRIRPCGCCGPGCSSASSRSRTPPSRRIAAPR